MATKTSPLTAADRHPHDAPCGQVDERSSRPARRRRRGRGARSRPVPAGHDDDDAERDGAARPRRAHVLERALAHLPVDVERRGSTGIATHSSTSYRVRQRVVVEHAERLGGPGGSAASTARPTRRRRRRSRRLVRPRLGGHPRGRARGTCRRELREERARRGVIGLAGQHARRASRWRGRGGPAPRRSRRASPWEGPRGRRAAAAERRPSGADALGRVGQVQAALDDAREEIARAAEEAARARCWSA